MSIQPEHVAAFTRAVIEQTACLVAIALFVATIGVWACILMDKMQ
jgi:hypothetical protein